jgi:hypothetical protein
MASKIATLMAMMTKKNFPIACLSHDPTQSSANSSPSRPTHPLMEKARRRGGPSEVKA